MRILLSNDDGVHAPGIRAMYRELAKFGQVWVVAPMEERSTTGHSLTLHKPLRMTRIAPHFYGVTGSPADCIYMGIRQVIGRIPDLVVSGVNRGANLGQDVYYSGTVSAAREASIIGVPSMAVSLAIDFKKQASESNYHFDTAAKLAARVLREVIRLELPKHTLLNLNVPDLPYGKVKGVKLARQGFRYYTGDILRRKDHRGRDYYWVGGNYKGYLREADTDCTVVERGYASLTPIKLDSTDTRCMVELSQSWKEGILPKGAR